MSLIRVAVIVAVLAGLVAALFYSRRPSGPLVVSGFIESDEIRVGSRIGGRVRNVEAEEGTAVTSGQILVELEPFDLLERKLQAEKTLEARAAEYRRIAGGFRAEEVAQAKARRDQLAARLDRLRAGPRAQEIAIGQAQLELADAELQLAQLQYDRTRALVARNATTQEEMDRASSVLRKSRSQQEVRREELSQLREGTRREEIAEAQAQLDEAEQEWQLRRAGSRQEDVEAAKASMEAAEAALHSIETQIEELKVRAPADGIVEAIDLEPGDLVPADAPVLSIILPQDLWVRAYVPENHLNLQIGQKVTVGVDSFPGQRFAAHISFISRSAEFTPGNVQTPEERSKQVFRIKVTLDEGLDRLRPGMSADVYLDETGRGSRP